MAPRGYHYDAEFPREAFVQQSVENYFLAQGFELRSGGPIDLVCRHPATGEQWQVEAKGHTTQIGLDFRTALGQLVQRMTDPATIHAVAVPDTPSYRSQLAQLAPWVAEVLNIRWLVVAPDGTTTAIDARSGPLPASGLKSESSNAS